MHPNEELIRNTYSAMARGDGRALAEVLSPDTLWVVPGSSTLSGRYIGPDQIFGFWKRVAEQTAGGLALHVEDVLANDQRAVALVTVRGERKSQHLDERQFAVFELAEGKISKATFVYENPDAYDDFWRE